MTVTSRVSTLVFRSGLYLLLALGAAACSGHRILVQKPEQVICVSDEGTVRACLVTDPGDGKITKNIPIGNTGCYWFNLMENPGEKNKQFRREATGRPRQFTFLVVNQCAASVDVRFDIAKKRTVDLEFLDGPVRADAGAQGPCEVVPKQTAEPGAPKEGEPKGPDHFRQLRQGPIAAKSDVSVQCHTLPYPHKLIGGRRLRRTFNLVATGYDGKPITEVPFDPDVELEKAGSTP
jgi:hypothetical protein